jgi:hypothetical protein
MNYLAQEEATGAGEVPGLEPQRALPYTVL